ncbi:MAG: hypothetical protein Edafosvirus10_11 [Edafosvirus sp.]|uniref:Uncharacterized protein n=1 Tax=Edafosvirus sp. TaxID=2487765 RepID=A0A3G4ZTV7_9VIRU|nr:MAG: hypothetical protein Edafosvirus10_11 [Edafosvirus sp.]
MDDVWEMSETIPKEINTSKTTTNNIDIAFDEVNNYYVPSRNNDSIGKKEEPKNEEPKKEIKKEIKKETIKKETTKKLKVVYEEDEEEYYDEYDDEYDDYQDKLSGGR